MNATLVEERISYSSQLKQVSGQIDPGLTDDEVLQVRFMKKIVFISNRIDKFLMSAFSHTMYLIFFLLVNFFDQFLFQFQFVENTKVDVEVMQHEHREHIK